jgi:hypothetical protein
MASRMYGRRTSKRRAEKIKHYVENVLREENSEEEKTGDWAEASCVVTKPNWI